MQNKTKKNPKKYSWFSKIIIFLVVILILLVGAFFYFKDNIVGWIKNPTAEATQMLLVTAKDWNSTTGTLQRYERASLDFPWQKVGDKINVTLGKNGMGWGIGLHGASLTFGPKVIEGSKRTPVGVFAINLAFGKDSAKKLGVKLPYKQITETIFCPDDTKSKFYNSLVDTKNTTKDWNSSENMNEYMNEGLYVYGFMVNHNYDHPIPGRGSCFFVHIYRGINIPTAGCTAFEPNLVKEIVVWLDPAHKPVLVQMPESVYKIFKSRWGLPVK